MDPVPFIAELGSKLIHISSLTLFFTLVSIILLLKSLRGRTPKNQKPKPNLPPGPWKLPIIGNMNQLAGSPPHHALRDLALRYGPLMHLQLGQVSTIIVSDANNAKEIMKTHDLVFASRPQQAILKDILYQFTDIVFCQYGVYWRQIRKICILELFSVKRVQSFRSIREEEVSSMVRDLFSAAEIPVNLTQMVFSFINNVACRVAVGDKCSDQAGFMKAMVKSLELAGGFSISDFFPSLEFVNAINGTKMKSKKIHRELNRLFDQIIEEHKRRETGENPDLVDVLLEVQMNGQLEVPLTDDNIKAIIQDMFIAGTDTSSTVINWAMAELLRNPRVMKKAQENVRDILGGRDKVEESDIQNMNYLKLIIKETLRLHPPLPLLVPRESVGRCEIQGYDIPSKTRVIVNFWAIARNPKHWENPEIFEPERFSDNSIDFKGQHFEFIPFGSGRRGCPAISLGLAIVELALAQLLYYFDWKLPNGSKPENLDMTESFKLSASRREDLLVIPIPRISPHK